MIISKLIFISISKMKEKYRKEYFPANNVIEKGVLCLPKKLRGEN